MTDTVRPMLRVLRGSPTAEELAALVAVVSARTTRATRPRDTSAWTDRSRLVRSCPAAGTGAWRNSGRRA